MIRLLPSPKRLVEYTGTFHVEGCDVVMVGDHDVRVLRAAVALRDALCARTGDFHKFYRGVTVKEQAICVLVDATLPKEGYALEVREAGVVLIGGDAAGCFYGIQSLHQLLDDAKEGLPCMDIWDAPDMGYRGFYQDATRGRIPSVAGVKKMVDLLARMKINSLQLYVEQSFDFAEFSNEDRTEDDHLTAQDLMEMDEYCYQHFIDFIPSLSTFGHLYDLLMKEEYRHLCELEDFEPEWHFWRERMFHHTIDATNPESIQVVCSLIDQYLPLFRSPYFNICCDETFDLAKGRNAGKESAELYIGFVKQVINHVKRAGKQVMMWADIAVEHPELLPQIPEDVILLNWEYSANPKLEKIEQVSSLGLQQIVCPGTSSWYALMETPSISKVNITKMLHCGYEYGAIGALNTSWGDYGHPAPFGCVLYGMAMGAALSWNRDTVFDEAFEWDASATVYRTRENVVALIRELGDLQLSARWLEFFEWQKLQTKECFQADTKAMEQSIVRCREIQLVLAEMTGEQDIFRQISVAARGIELLNMAALQISRRGETDDGVKEAFESWLDEYRDVWLLFDKPSELAEIEQFIRNI